MVKNLSVMQETRVQDLGREDPLEKGMAIHSSILAWRIPRTEKPGGLQFMGLQRAGHDLVTEQQQRKQTFVCALGFGHRCGNAMKQTKARCREFI